MDAVVSERALREIYLKGFEMAIKEGGAQSVMTTYNPLNSRWTASNYDLNTTILRKQWGYKGIVMTDWWANMNDVVEGGPGSLKYTGSMVRAQNDLYMVVNNYGAEINSNEDDTMEALALGKLEVGELQRSAMNICSFLMEIPAFFRKQERNSEVKKFKAKAQIDVNEMYHLSSGTNEIPVAMGNTVGIKVDKPGTYRLIAYMMSPDTNLAQTACNMTLNGETVTTIQTCGTLGKWIKQQLDRIVFEEGFYELKLEVLKPNIEVKWIQLKEI